MACMQCGACRGESKHRTIALLTLGFKLAPDTNELTGY